ncbi:MULTISPECIES: CobW family GTP-binding protein [unclassified Marinovum]
MSVPVLLVTGFLGAGKTSFINRLLHEDHGLRIAAIVNDFGAINIDAALLDGAADGVIGLRNGCICCSLQGDLLRTLKIVLGQTPVPELIVIEASGVADPAGIAQSLADPVLWSQVRLETIACVIDAPDVPVRAKDPLWKAQVAGSDILCLAKTAGMRDADLSAVRDSLSALGKRHLFDLAEAFPLAAVVHPEPRKRAQLGTPLQDDRFVHLEWQHRERIDLLRFQRTMSALAPSVMRAKGFVCVDEGQLLFQMAGTRATLSRVPNGLGAAEQGCQLVLIGERGRFQPDVAKRQLDGLR